MITMGVVQKEIQKGVPATKVLVSLGSPNIVTTDDAGREVWIYDKFSTDETYSKDSGGAGIGIGDYDLTMSNFSFSHIGASYKKSAGATSKTQRTLTVIIKFNEKKKVDDFAYHVSRF
jgi:hypothetical protein